MAEESGYFSPAFSFSPEAMEQLRELVRVEAAKVDPVTEREHLRDYFAAQALAGTMANRDARAWEAAAKKLGIEPDAALARGMYMMADAMLAERQRGAS